MAGGHDVAGMLYIPRYAAMEYEQKRDLLSEAVSHALSVRPDIGLLIGDNLLEVMQGHHRGHAGSMVSVLKFNEFDLLDRIMAWSYRYLHFRGFSYEYFPVAVRTWMDVVHAHLQASSAGPIVRVYRHVLERHEELMARSERPCGVELLLEPAWSGVRDSFVSAVLAGDHRECLSLAKGAVVNGDSLDGFLDQVIEPALYHVGELWERNEILVAEEHLASGITLRMLASLLEPVAADLPPLGKVVMTTAPYERHEIGARIISDLLSREGWDVDCLGANTPAVDLARHAVSVEADVIGISIGVPSSLDTAQHAISLIRQEPSLHSAKIVVGGYLLRMKPDVWQLTGADGWASNAKEAVSLIKRWHKELYRHQV